MLKLLDQRWSSVAAVAIVGLSILLGLLARRLFLGWLARLAGRSAWAADTAVIASLRRPLPLWFFVGGVYLASRLLSTPPALARTLERTLVSVLVVSTTVWIANLAARLLELRGEGAGGLPAASATGVVRSLVKLALLAIGGMVLLSTLGISVAPVLTTMGLGGLAVALGLRETLSNLFAGMQITLAGYVSVGDFVKLESGDEGYVEDIHWRVTRIKTLLNTVVVIPNNRFAESIVTNYHLPSKGVGILVPLGVHGASDLQHVERVICGVARAIMRTVQGGVPEFEPFIRYQAFGDSSIELQVILRGREITDQLLIRHEFIKALVPALAAERIVVPFPVRAINLEQERPRDSPRAAEPARESADPVR